MACRFGGGRECAAAPGPTLMVGPGAIGYRSVDSERDGGRSEISRRTLTMLVIIDGTVNRVVVPCSR